MIIDPHGNGVEIFYDDKIKNLVGHPERIRDWIVDLCSMSKDEYDYDEFDKYHKPNEFVFYGENWVQITYPHLDINGFGRMWADLFDEVGFKWDKVSVEKVVL